MEVPHPIELVLDELSETEIEEIWNGAYVHVADNQKVLYTLCKSYPGAKVVQSSHRHEGDQYALPVPGTEAVYLVGYFNGGTFFQMERHSTEAGWNVFKHIGTFIAHLLFGKNYGPNGSSNYTERIPLHIKVDSLLS